MQLVPTSTFRTLVCYATLSTIWPYIKFLFVGSKTSLHRLLHPIVTDFDLWFATLGSSTRAGLSPVRYVPLLAHLEKALIWAFYSYITFTINKHIINKAIAVKTSIMVCCLVVIVDITMPRATIIDIILA